MSNIKNQAIQTALTGDWTNAISLNKQILDEDPDDIDTLNRIAFAYMSLGSLKNAKKFYERVLSLDLENPIAIRNLKRLKETNGKPIPAMLSNIFIEETGKTKIIDLINVADKKIISNLNSGEEIHVRIKRNKIFALDSEEQYIGMLPDDIAQRLIKFMTGGNEYVAYIRNVGNKKISIFIKETKKTKRFESQPSFISAEKPKFSITQKSSKK